jgi:hypothetical protein
MTLFLYVLQLCVCVCVVIDIYISPPRVQDNMRWLLESKRCNDVTVVTGSIVDNLEEHIPLHRCVLWARCFSIHMHQIFVNFDDLIVLTLSTSILSTDKKEEKPLVLYVQPYIQPLTFTRLLRLIYENDEESLTEFRGTCNTYFCVSNSIR